MTQTTSPTPEGAIVVEGAASNDSSHLPAAGPQYAGQIGVVIGTAGQGSAAYVCITTTGNAWTWTSFASHNPG